MELNVMFISFEFSNQNVIGTKRKIQQE